MKASFDEWLEAVKEIAGKDYAKYEDYSFQTAYDYDMYPHEAVAEAHELWVNS